MLSQVTAKFLCRVLGFYLLLMGLALILTTVLR